MSQEERIASLRKQRKAAKTKGTIGQALVESAIILGMVFLIFLLCEVLLGFEGLASGISVILPPLTLIGLVGGYLMIHYNGQRALLEGELSTILRMSTELLDEVLSERRMKDKDYLDYLSRVKEKEDYYDYLSRVKEKKKIDRIKKRLRGIMGK